MARPTLQGTLALGLRNVFELMLSLFSSDLM